MLAGGSLVELGSGAGTYTAAFLDAHPDTRATVVDFDDVLALARDHLARFGDRVRYVGGDATSAETGLHDVALLANVVHLHAPESAARLVAAAVERVAPSGLVAIKDLRVEGDRSGPMSSLMFALNMAIYTGGGDVYTTAQLRAWLEAAGLVAIEEHRLATSPDSIVVLARKPPLAPRRAIIAGLVAAHTDTPIGARAMFDRVTGLGATAAAVEGELDVALAATDPSAAMPAPLRHMLAHAIAYDRASAEPFVRHYTNVMPHMRAAQLDGPAGGGANDALLHARLDWQQLPRMRAAIERLFAVLAEHAARVPVAGATTASELYATTHTLVELYARTHYGGCMPLLYGYPADLAYFASRGAGSGADAAHATIDRYLVAPVIHELCHFARDRDALPPHLDECIGGWLAVHVWPEFAYPAAGHDDAIYAAPWLAQIGQAFARRFGVGPIVRAQSGAVAWDSALPPAFVERITGAAWTDWTERRTLHFLADTLDPEPWLALVGTQFPDDASFDRAIVGAALRAMCLSSELVAGSFRTRTRVPDAAIDIDAIAARMTAPAGSGAADTIAPRYWLPPAVAAAVRARGHAGYALYLGSIEAIPRVVATLCDGTPPSNFVIVPREIGDTD
jgi:hypothetical protein